jgi:hypothetical protein
MPHSEGVVSDKLGLHLDARRSQAITVASWMGRPATYWQQAPSGLRRLLLRRLQLRPPRPLKRCDFFT